MLYSCNQIKKVELTIELSITSTANVTLSPKLSDNTQKIHKLAFDNKFILTTVFLLVLVYDCFET